MNKLFLYGSILVLIVCTIAILIPSVGIGHGHFDVPIYITPKKEIIEAKSKLVSYFEDTPISKRTAHSWRNLTKNDLGIYTVSVPTSVSYRSTIFKGDETSHLHPQGVSLSFKFKDGTDFSITCPIQEHPKNNYIVINAP
tara:strand:- start:1610 stop:2029 length:420 start_codon:yes stop_codon:yes gene_type:complete